MQKKVKYLTDKNIKQKQQKINGEDKQPPQNVTNALFVGSTAELQKIVKGRDNV